MLLVSCFGVLIGGAIFSSAQFSPDGAANWVVTVVVGMIIVVTLGLFAWMLGAEVRRAFKAAAAREHAQRFSDASELKRKEAASARQAASVARRGGGGGDGDGGVGATPARGMGTALAHAARLDGGVTTMNPMHARALRAGSGVGGAQSAHTGDD